jgi:hypothetical protein
MRRKHLIGLAIAVLCALPVAAPALATDLGPQPQYQLVEPPASGWTFTFTPYGWLTGINGNVTARGHSVDIDENFVQIAEKSDSLIALMGYFEARKGRFGFFADVVWADLGFPGSFDVKRSRLGRFTKDVLRVNGRAQLDYEETIIQSGVAFEVAKWANAGRPGFTALDVMGSARYWNNEADVNLNVSGSLEVDVRRLGLQFRRNGSRAVARTGTLEWVDPVVGARLRHQTASGSDINLEGDVGGFGAGSEFSWQAVATYGFDVNVFQTTMRSVVGYRALSVDYSEDGRHGKNGIDWIQHGPVLGVAFRW